MTLEAVPVPSPFISDVVPVRSPDCYLVPPFNALVGTLRFHDQHGGRYSWYGSATD